MADIATLGIQVKMDGVAQANRGLGDLEKQAGKTEGAAGRLGGGIGKLSGAFSILQGVAAGAAGAFSVSAIAGLADQWSDLSSRVNLAAGSMEKGGAVMRQLQKLANDTYSSLELTVEGYIANASTLQALGKSTQQALTYTEALNNAMVISGAKGQRAAQVQDALAKAMALGKLSGDQLNTVIANGGAVTEALAAELGVSVLQLRKLGAQGKITGDVIYNALTKRAEEFAEKAGDMPATIGDAFQRIQNNTLSFIGTFDQATNTSGAFAEVLLSVANNVDRIITTVGTAVTAFGVYYVGALGAAAVATAGLSGALAFLRGALIKTGIGVLVVALGEIVYQMMEARKATNSWGEAFSLLGERLSLIFKGIGRAFNGVTDVMKSAWFAVMSSMVSTTEAAVGAIYKSFGATFAGFGKLSENLRDKSTSAMENSADAFRDAGDYFSQAAAEFGDIKLPDLSGDAGKAYRATEEMSKSARGAADAYAELLRSAQQRVQQMEQEVQLVGMNSIAADVLRMKLDMLHQAQEKGLKLSQAQKDQLNAQADAYGRAAQKVAELTLMEDARFARAQLGRSAIEQQIASDLKNAGIEMDSVAGQAYASYAKLTDAISTAKTEAKSFASSFISDLLNGKSATESLIGALKKLGDKLIDMALDEMINGLFKNLLGILGGGGGGGFMGASFFPPAPAIGGGIGLFADGGISNKPAIFGEAGPEAAVPLPDGRSIPVTLSSGGGKTGGDTIKNEYNFTGTQKEFEQFQKFVMERDRQFDARAQRAVINGQKKNKGYN